MFKKLIKKSKEQKGFTIIEVMIVLAIAGLILVVVLLAIPQLQRNQRNEARRSATARIVSEIQNFSGNNNGVYPLPDVGTGLKNIGGPTVDDSFFTRYLGCDNSGTEAVCSANINDPQTGFPMGSGDDGASVGISVDTDALGDLPGSLYYMTGVICDGEATTGAGQRNFAFMSRLEGGAAYCLDNR
jgi:prepilin-type N-terminal cleavage/methylation domain-containing protein